MAMLFITKGPSQGVSFSLAGHRLVMIGRDAGCTIQIVDPQLSRNHLQIKHVPEENRHHAVDFGSKNGVFVNGTKIESPTPLADRDVIALGDSVLVYSAEDSPFAQHVLNSLKQFGHGHERTISND